MEQVATSAPTTELPVKDTITDDISIPNEQEALRDVFRTADRSSRTTEYLKLIWDFAKEKAPNKDRESVIYEAIRLKNHLGSPSLGESPFTRIINYIKVSNRVKNDTKMLEEMNNGI